MINKLRPREHG